LPKDLVVEEVKVTSPRNFSRRVQTRPTKQEAPKQLEASKMVNFIVLDTGGTDLATPEYRMFDERSRELFLRHIQLEIAEKFVFVSSKFNQKSQWNIQKLINQLNHKPEKKITSKNRLIVVHNLIDVEDEDTLTSRIEEVEYCYDPEHNEEAWKRMGTTVFVNSKSHQHVYYQTELTVHLFMVRHPKEDYVDNWRYLRNMSAVEVLKQLLLSSNPRRFNLFKEFLTASEILMSRYQYLKSWDDTYCIKFQDQDGVKRFLPFRKKICLFLKHRSWKSNY